MFKVYKPWLYLILSVLLFLGAFIAFQFQKFERQPENIVKTIAQNLDQQINEFQKKLTSESAVQRIIKGQRNAQDLALISQKPYTFFIFKNNNLSFWSNNKTNYIPLNENQLKNGAFLSFQNKKYWVKLYNGGCLSNDQKLICFFLIHTYFPNENDYLETHFEGQSNIPKTASIEFNKTNSQSLPIISNAGKLYAFFNPTALPTSNTDFLPNEWVVLLTCLALLFLILFSLFQVYRYSISFKNPQLVFYWSFGIIALRVLLFYTNLPFHFKNLNVFSPLLYASSNKLPSLGDLVLNLICVLWIALLGIDFLLVAKPTEIKFNKWQKRSFQLFFCLLIVACSWLWGSVMKGIIYDSNIDFEKIYYYQFDNDLIWGMVSLSFLNITAFFSLYLIISLLFRFRQFDIYFSVFLISTILFFIFLLVNENERLPFLYSLLILLFIGLFVILHLRKNFRSLISPFQILSFSVFSLVTVLFLFYFGGKKELQNRKKFAERIANLRDDVLEFDFESIGNKIQNNAQVFTFFSQPSALNKTIIDDSLLLMLNESSFDNYEKEFFAFDVNKNPLYNNQNIDESTLENNIDNAASTFSKLLYYRDIRNDENCYLAQIPIEVNQQTNHLYIEFSKRKKSNNKLYDEIAHVANTTKFINNSRYSYGVYQNNNLVLQSNDYPFNQFDNETLLNNNEFNYFNIAGFSKLIYRPNSSNKVILLKQLPTFADYFSLFILLLILLCFTYGCIILVFNVINILQNRKFNFIWSDFSVKQRIQVAIISIIVVSFIIIATFTIISVKKRFLADNEKERMSKIAQIRNQVQSKIFTNNGNNVFESDSLSQYFQSELKTIANNQNINIYNHTGKLAFTSQKDFFQLGLISNLINPEVLTNENNHNNQMVKKNETIGKLNYVSYYLPIKNANNKLLGFINLPMFSSQKELHIQISNILLTIINLYTFIFILASFLLYFVSKNLTRPFNLLIEQFKRVKLQKNEVIHWPYKDEFRTLVDEYNIMVKKLEENAMYLAKTERDSAWREMAKQVAHEIKNPLTPMKLNVQYLQQAIRSNNPKALEMTDKMSQSLIEQIDNLSYIASEFSNFAKLPESVAEVIKIDTLLINASELYKKEPNIDLNLEINTQDVYVSVDKSQLLRVFTNLLQNSVEAINASKKQGFIKISLNQIQDKALIIFQDNGSGIPLEKQEKLFQPYFTTKSSGTGLGLAMSHKIIETWHGKIWFESIENVGTTFFIELPVSFIFQTKN